jgi:hypothetical protein
MLTTIAWLSLLSAPTTSPQDPVRPPDGIEWQRSLTDALAVQQATGLPLLIAVNMDGEVFNDRFAGTVYRDPRFVQTTRGYVCVVASPDRHTETDYDAFGRRVECPRFPGCTCSEHIQIEPALFARWFRGTRNAPRHVGVDQAGNVLFDRFLDASMQTAIDAIEAHRGRPQPDALAARTLTELFARRDAGARRTLEQRYAAADAGGRRAILAAAATATNEPADLLRMALRDPDDATFTLAAAALAKVATAAMRIDIEDALARCDDATVTTALVARLASLGGEDAAAGRLAAHFAPATTPTALPAPWGGPWRSPAFVPGDRLSVEAELDRCEAQLRTAPNDDSTRLQLAIAQAAFAEVLIAEGGRRIEFWFADSRGNAERVRHTALQQEVQALLAHVAYMTSDAEAAARATTLAQLPATNARQPDPWLATRLLELVLLSTVNGVYADGEAAARRHLRSELDRATALLDLLQQRGGAGEQAMLAGIGLLEFAGLRRAARLRLEQLAASLPGSAAVHERWRNRLRIDLGAEAMRRRYAAFVDGCADKPTAEWFAGHAAMIAGEQHTRDRRNDAGQSAYGEAVDRLERCVAGNESFADSAHHLAVLALAGRAHLRFEAGDAEGAVADLLRAAALRPASLDETDGLLRKPRAIATRIAGRLREQGKTELATRLDTLGT